MLCNRGTKASVRAVEDPQLPLAIVAPFYPDARAERRVAECPENSDEVSPVTQGPEIGDDGYHEREVQVPVLAHLGCDLLRQVLGLNSEGTCATQRRDTGVLRVKEDDLETDVVTDESCADDRGRASQPPSHLHRDPFIRPGIERHFGEDLGLAWEGWVALAGMELDVEDDPDGDLLQAGIQIPHLDLVGVHSGARVVSQDLDQEGLTTVD
jgi:hypothetical protein